MYLLSSICVDLAWAEERWQAFQLYDLSLNIEKTAGAPTEPDIGKRKDLIESMENYCFPATASLQYSFKRSSNFDCVDEDVIDRSLENWN